MNIEAFIAAKKATMFTAKDSSSNPTKKLADLKDAGFGTHTREYTEEHKKVMGVA